MITLAENNCRDTADHPDLHLHRQASFLSLVIRQQVKWIGGQDLNVLTREREPSITPDRRAVETF